MCRRCKKRKRWKKGEWCKQCIEEVCCSHYPKIVNGRWVDCKHHERERRA